MANSLASTAVCSVCGEALGANRVCFACLLRAGLDEADQPVESEAAVLFDDFEIARREDGSLWELGRGAMGVTYRATEKTLHRSVALKVIELRGSEAKRERFLREVRAAAALRHPNVAGVFRVGALADGDRCFCAMELIEGETLDSLVRRDGPLSLEIALEIAIQVTRALIAAAERDLVHRDLKPDNIMVTRSLSSPGKVEVKVIDFGLAKAVSAVAGEMDLTHGQFVGTPFFASPEQFAGGPIDARADIYALGVTLWFALSGRRPFAGYKIEEIRQQHESHEKLPLEQLQGVPQPVIELLRSCLAIDPAERPASARELMKALESCKAQLATRRQTGKLAALAAVAVLVLGVAALMFWRSSEHNPTVSAPFPEKSIAVLPFENRSRDPENAFFTDGVQDEILTDLARIAALKVISRTSVMQYKTGAKRNLHQIGNELGVAHVLEGSVQRAGNRVRVNAQLIDARTDAHLWAQTYDRDLADVFAIQSEIARAIADQLQAKLSATEKSAIEQAPTTDLTAFDLYSRAKPLLEESNISEAKTNWLQAIDLLNQAVGRDPSFFDAYCQLAYAHDTMYFAGYDHTPARLALAEAAIQTAFLLRPHAGEAHLARAWNLYRGYLDYEGALAELEIARQSLPNDAQIFRLMGYVQRRRGRWDESIRNLERAVELDPRGTGLLQQTAFNYLFLRRYPDEEAALDRALAIAPNDLPTQADRALAELNWHADTRPMHQMVDSIQATNPGALPRIADPWLICALAERNAAAAEEALNAFGENRPSLSNDTVFLTRLFVEGLVARMTKDEDKARSAFIAARAEQEKTVQAQPDYGPALCLLGLIDAGLGRKKDALREGARAIQLLPVEKDAVNGAVMIKYFAVIAAWVGEKDLACEQLAIAIRHPSSLSYGKLKLMPFWDPLRGDPRFEKIVASLAPKDQKR
jgi:TolB-like protein/predicted Ser/Thr protein kinase